MGDDAVSAPPTSWLDLLAEGGSAGELEDRLRARLTAADPAERDRLQAEAEQVRQIRARLDERRQRAEELAALNDLARRLASLRDPEVVLTEVARQARRLLAVDVAYIMRLHPGDVLRIEVIDGSMGSVMRGIELPRGTGLGGEVLRTGQPLWSERYLDDARFPHLDRIDAAASSEQLGGILGVPLIVDDETIGVLLASDRRSRRFADREIELLAALAAHAAVAIRNAELFDRLRVTADELTATNAALTSANAIRQRSADLRERLNVAVIGGGRFAEVATQLEQALGAAVQLRDADNRVLAGALPAQAPDAQTFAATGPDTPTRFTPEDGPAGLEAVAAPVFLPSGYAGCLIAMATPALDEEAVRLLGIGATSVALVMAWERSLAEAELRSRGEFVNALLAAEADPTSLRRRARSIGIDLERVSAVAVLDPGQADPQSAAGFAAQLAGSLGGWSAEHAGHLVVLLPAVEPAAVKERVTRLAAGRPLPAAIGVAAVTNPPAGVRAAYESARQTATVLLALGRPADCAEAVELGVYRSLFSQAGRDEIRTFVELTIGPLLAHDHERQRDLVRTLATYLEQSQHHARTCATLHIHANTLYQRLDRITELIGPGWKDPVRSLDVQLALRLQHLVGRVVE